MKIPEFLRSRTFWLKFSWELPTFSKKAVIDDEYHRKIPSKDGSEKIEKDVRPTGGK